MLVLGHTGFKGSWLSLWLHRLGASVAGFALPPPTEPSLFALAGLEALIATTYGDIRDPRAVREAVRHCCPDIVFHLAAQPLVRRSLRDPVETYATNVMGTVHVLEAVRSSAGVRGVIVVTSDKCYENRDWPWGYRETDALGGVDPYSSSKACAELVAAAWRRSFFPAIATARAGNVIGGGDWAEDRLVPDCIRAFSAGRPVAIRSPRAIRPWQHVLDPLRGYLLLAERLYADAASVADAWNFGPLDDDAWPVKAVASYVAERWGGSASWHEAADGTLHEAVALKVDGSRARVRLGWSPRLRLIEALNWTIDWYRSLAAGEPARALTEEQLERYQDARP